MKKRLLLFTILLLLFAGISCTKEEVIPDNTVDTEILYSNSFEASTDTIGWGGGACWVVLHDDISSLAGVQSASVSCGCIGPSIYYEIPAFEEDNNVIISCYAKSLGMGGAISLYAGEEQISIPMEATNVWQYYTSTDTLFCPAGEAMKIYLSAGGIAYGEIRVDLLELKTVE